MHAVDPLCFSGFLQKTLQDLTGYAVHTAHGRDDPQFVADPYLTVAAAVNLYLTICRLRR
ncbi:hypothetical protein D3C76_1447700 [compost metagenome]